MSSTRRLSDILTNALSDKLGPRGQVELRNALFSLETQVKATGDVVQGDRHISHVSMGNLVLGYAEGLTILNPENGRMTVALEPDGDSRFGSDLGNVGKTSLFILANAQKYNGENLGDGDVLFGDNSSGKANMLWDRSDGKLKFRGGATTQAYIDTDGTIVAGAGAVRMNTTGITASLGLIGGWVLGTSFLVSGSGSTRVGLDSGGTNPALYAGSSTPGSAPFRVTNTGALTATNATITGTITANTGEIGGWTIASKKIYAIGIILDSELDQIQVGASTPRLVLDGANKHIRSSTFVTGFQGFSIDGATGNAEFNNIIARGVLKSAVFEKDVVSVVGGTVAILDGDVLDADMTALDSSTLTIKGETTFALFDVLRIKDGIDDEWLRVTDVTNAPTYSVSRDQAGSFAANSNPAWKKGQAVVNYGASGEGGILMTSNAGLVPYTTSGAPYINIFTHAGSPWATLTPRVHIGNMRNQYGTGANDRFGFGVGDYSSGNYLSYNAEAANKFILKAAGGIVVLDEAGINIVPGTSAEAIRSYQVTSGDGYSLLAGGYADATTVGGILWNQPSAKDGYLYMRVSSPAGHIGDIRQEVSTNSVQRANLRVRGSTTGGSVDVYTAGLNVGTSMQGVDRTDGNVNVGGSIGIGRVPTTRFDILATTGTPALISVHIDTDEATMLRLDKRTAAGTNAKRWDLMVDDNTGIMKIRPVDSSLPFQVTSLGGAVALYVDTGSGDVRVGGGLYVGSAVGDPLSDQLIVEAQTALTNTLSTNMASRHNTTGTPAAGFGTQFRFGLESTTTENRDAASISVLWTTATDASRTARMQFAVYDATASREFMRGEASGTAPMIGFLGAAAIARPSVTGSRGGNAALASLLTQLANLGLITDSTTA